ncbi:MAG TPA: MMPL family transporter [Acidimicrobiales bacterium]|nr:MMPL family transporter [Acidimicrobiales bacterium]
MRGIARFCHRHHRLVIAAWVAVVALVAGVAHLIGSSYSDNFSLPGTGTQETVSLLQRGFPQQAGDREEVVVHALRGTLDDPDTRARVEAMVAAVARSPHVATATDPYAQPGSLSADRRTGFVMVQMDQRPQNLHGATVRKLVATARGYASGSLQVELEGQGVESAQRRPPAGTEAIGLMAAILVLLVSFGSVVAMGMPVLTALLALGIGLGAVGLLSRVTSVVDFAPQVAAMMGLGVGIDYALFIVTRYRASLREGMHVGEAVETAMDTSGRAVLFAGTTVVISLLGMLLLNVAFVRGLAVAAAVAVLMTMAASLTLLPALLGGVGTSINRLRVPGRHPQRTAGRSPAWSRWARTIQRHPVIACATSASFLLLLAVPMLSLRLGSSDAGSDPRSTTARQAYDLLARGFGPGFNGPLTIAVRLPHPGDAAGLARLESAVASTPDVAAVAPPRLSPSGTVAVISAFPRTAPQDAPTADLVRRLRSSVIPAALSGTGAVAYVGGTTAAFIDLGSTLSSRLPWFIGGVVLLSVLLLTIVFRSVVVPLKAAAMNLLSISAAFGLVTAVFQWGWGASLLHVDRTGPIESFLPVMLFAILFGLSMDYEVFLLSRVHEEWVATSDNSRAVREGLAATGGVITAAAAIMVAVFGSFTFGGERVIAEFGLGLASAVFLDALVIRTVLVPSVMQLLGRRNWWLPGWLRWLPVVHLEAEEPLPEASVATEEDEPEPTPAGV